MYSYYSGPCTDISAVYLHSCIIILICLSLLSYDDPKNTTSKTTNSLFEMYSEYLIYKLKSVRFFCIGFSVSIILKIKILTRRKIKIIQKGKENWNNDEIETKFESSNDGHGLIRVGLSFTLVRTVWSRINTSGRENCLK